MKRRLAKLALFLLLGAIVNVAVAWGCALFVVTAENPVNALAAISHNPEGWVTEAWAASSWRGFGSQMVSTTWVRTPTGTSQFQEQVHPSEIIPRWCACGNPPDTYASGSSDRERLIVVGRGWPMIALHHEIQPDETDPFYVFCGAIDLGWGNRLQDGSSMPRLLPLRVYWPAMLFNTALYATFLWLPFAPFQLRRYLRVKRGLCIKCGYDLRETPDKCPECSWGREAEA